MTMRQRLRRRSAIREILRNLETRPFCEETPPVSGGWLNQRRPGLRHGSPRAQTELTTAIADEVFEALPPMRVLGNPTWPRDI